MDAVMDVVNTSAAADDEVSAAVAYAVVAFVEVFLEVIACCCCDCTEDSPHRHHHHHHYLQCLDGVYGGNGKRQWTPERNALGNTCARFKRAGVGTNGIPECKILSKPEHRASTQVRAVSFVMSWPAGYINEGSSSRG
jgi:hypothetical protein